MRDHQPVVIEDFNGLWKRGDADSVPLDHFVESLNLAYIESGFRTRDGINPFIATRSNGERSIVRMYTFDVEGANDGLITLDVSGNFYHIKPDIPSATLILSVLNAQDFSMAVINGRAYITPFRPNASFSDFVYVYNGDGTLARKIGGIPPKDADGAFTAATGAAGTVEAGIHIFGVVYETNSGFLTQIGPDTLEVYTAPGAFKVNLTAIPASPNTYVVARHIVASKSINPANYNGDTRGYELFFVPDGDINDNVTTTLTVDFFDSELLESAANLLDLFTEVSNGKYLAIYHNRLVICGQGNPSNANLVRISNVGEFEAFDQVTGFLVQQNDGLGIECCQEFRDILYLFKINQTTGFTDNGDVPTSWQETILDQGLGASSHGVCFVDTRGGMNIEFIILANYSGIFIFNGVFQKPELSYKILDFWLGLDQVDLAVNFQIYNDALHQILYISIPSLFMILIGDYTVGLTHKDIKWGKWTYDVQPTTITLLAKDEKLLIGSNGVKNPASESI